MNRPARIMLVMTALAMSLMSATPASAVPPFMQDENATVLDQHCFSAYGYCVILHAEGNAIENPVPPEGAKLVFECEVSVIPNGSVPTKVVVATRVQQCYMLDGDTTPRQSNVYGLTLPGTESAIATDDFQSAWTIPMQVCVLGRVFFQDNTEQPVPPNNQAKCGF